MVSGGHILLYLLCLQVTTVFIIVFFPNIKFDQYDNQYGLILYNSTRVHSRNIQKHV